MMNRLRCSVSKEVLGIEQLGLGGWRHNHNGEWENAAFDLRLMGDGYLGIILRERATGFQDYYGNEIFEGDTLIWIDVELEKGVERQDTQQQVYWDEKQGAWLLDDTFKQDKAIGNFLANELRDFRYQISGNIHTAAWHEMINEKLNYQKKMSENLHT